MPEKIESKDVVTSADVQNVVRPGKLQIFLESSPGVLKLVFAFAIVAAVGYVCLDTLHSADPDMKQFKQAAFTVLTGFGTGAIGFIFGVYNSKSSGD